MKVLQTIAQVRAARASFPVLGLVPTMGFLHAGHLSLVERAKAECGAVAVSIFVNPTQFSPQEDLGRYPRDLPRDLALLEAAGTDLVFAPDPAEVYPPGFDTRIEIGGVTSVLEGAVRPGHFAGVATVVFRSLTAAQARFEAGERGGDALREAIGAVLAAEPLITVDYVSIADPTTLQEAVQVRDGAIASLAVRLGTTRLIDNLLLGVI